MELGEQTYLAFRTDSWQSWSGKSINVHTEITLNVTENSNRPVE